MTQCEKKQLKQLLDLVKETIEICGACEHLYQYQSGSCYCEAPGECDKTHRGNKCYCGKFKYVGTNVPAGYIFS